MALRFCCESAAVKSMIYVITLTTVAGFVGYLVCSEGAQIRFSIIFNGGETVCGMHVYMLKWERGLWTLAGVYFEQIPTGLIFYAKVPRMAAKVLRPMLVNATREVPLSYHHITRLSLGATPALLTLDDDKADAILEAVRMLFYGKHISPFKNGTADILNSTDRAFYLWVTISFLLNETFTRSNAAALELGEETLQLAFVSTEPESGPSLKAYPVLDQRVNIYARTYSSLGLEAATRIILKQDEHGYQSPCVVPQFPFLSKYASLLTYETSITNYTECYKNCQDFVKKYKVTVARDLDKRDIFATSYFYELARQAGMISKDAVQGKFNLTSIEEYAKEACRVPIDKKDRLCFDLTYLYALLRDGFTLPINKTIQITKEINGQEVDWTLGMALSQLYQ
ncbi:nucleoside-diphosphatase uda-1-like [Varroa destructor]|uniref:Uncharacterized protein n=1 Tax=Varroa destructor TaxID=109461 RepID=A0A7M7JQH2_VARDE|nr:nucleoside-diphosphatase uda-1-like [Varroa destructor]